MDSAHVSSCDTSSTHSGSGHAPVHNSYKINSGSKTRGPQYAPLLCSSLQKIRRRIRTKLPKPLLRPFHEACTRVSRICAQAPNAHPAQVPHTKKQHLEQSKQLREHTWAVVDEPGVLKTTMHSVTMSRCYLLPAHNPPCRTQAVSRLLAGQPQYWQKQTKHRLSDMQISCYCM